MNLPKLTNFLINARALLKLHFLQGTTCGSIGFVSIPHKLLEALWLSVIGSEHLSLEKGLKYLLSASFRIRRHPSRKGLSETNLCTMCVFQWVSGGGGTALPSGQGIRAHLIVWVVL